MKRRDLVEVPIDSVLPFKPSTVYITMSPGQWDGLLVACYEEGQILLEVEETEGGEIQVLRAFKRPAN